MTFASPGATFAGGPLAREGALSFAALASCGCSIPCVPEAARVASDPPVDDDDDDDDDDFLRKRDGKVDDDDEDDEEEDEDEDDEDDDADTMWTRAAPAWRLAFASARH